MSLVYATVDDLFVYQPLFDPPGDADLESDLREASRRVRANTRGALYDTQPSGLPKTDDLIDAYKEATCAQVVFWTRSKLNRVAVQAGTNQTVATKSMGGRAIGYKDTGATQQAASLVLCQEALDILTDAGLITTGVWAY